MKISSDIIWTNPRTVDIIAYLDWLKRPKTEKKILESNIKIKWYSTIESTESTKNILGPHTKFNENNNCATNNNDRNIGAITVAGRGIRNISFVSILNKSAKIWKAPFRPINVGPIRRWANAKSLRSVNTTKSVSNITKKLDINACSENNIN